MKVTAGISFAIPSDRLRVFLDQAAKKKSKNTPHLLPVVHILSSVQLLSLIKEIISHFLFLCVFLKVLGLAGQSQSGGTSAL